MEKLLFEIGLEELPASFIYPTLSQLSNNLEKMLKESNIDFLNINTYATPRRLSLVVDGLADKQKDIDEEIKGPPKRIALDEKGEFTRAGLGFIKKFNAQKESVFYKEINGQEYLYLQNHIQGKNTINLLPNILIDLIDSLEFSKPMRWGNGNTKFARPIRWLVAMHGQKVIDFTYAGIKTDQITKGHRFLGSDQIKINHPDSYLSLLEENHVIADLRKRKNLVLEQIELLEAQIDLNVVIEKELLDEVVNLIEYPTAFVGRFDETYLKLPSQVITTPMQEHQRYFPVKDKAENLTSYFIGVRNGNREYLDNVISGNEKVLDARLADAKFFYEEDMKRPLESYSEKLKKAVFQEDIGTIYQKAVRVEKIASFIRDELKLENVKKETLSSASMLIKSDLATLMVNEFPELQGIMGKKYALEQGYDENVANAIAEHYMPISSDGELPISDYGAIIAIADKIDTVVSCLAVGLNASGSQDPYALRRKAAGVIRIIIEKNYRLDLHRLFSFSYQLLEKTHREEETLWEDLWEFIKSRINNVWSEFHYDVLDSILGNENYVIYDLYKLAKAITITKETEQYASLLAGYKRANNLASRAEKSHLYSQDLLKEEEEIELDRALDKIEDEFIENIKNSNYEEALALFASLESSINSFFDNVMVMVDDEELKNNRLALLQRVVKLIKPIADLSKLVE